MLTPKDIKQIEEITSKNSNKAIMHFWDQILEPYFTKLTKLAEENRKEHQQFREEIVRIHEHLGDHDKRIRKLEHFTGIR